MCLLLVFIVLTLNLLVVLLVAGLLILSSTFDAPGPVVPPAGVCGAVGTEILSLVSTFQAGLAVSALGITIALTAFVTTFIVSRRQAKKTTHVTEARTDHYGTFE